MSRWLTIFIFALTSQLSPTLALEWKDVQEFARCGDYIGGLQATQKALDAATELKDRNIYSQWNGFFQSYLGAYAQAQKNTNAYFPKSSDKISEQDAKDLLEAVTLQPAIDAVLAKAKDHQILIINENHHIPQHRLFGRLLVGGLYKDGFRYFGFETLDETHEDFSKRGSVSRTSTGDFSVEPQMSQLIQAAYDTGFYLVKYDVHPDCKNCSGEDLIDRRDEGEAENLANLIKQNPKMKIVIWVGYSHAYKYQTNDSPKSRWMAARLWQKTGIEPYSIEQVSDRLARNDRQPEYEVFASKISGRDPVFIDLDTAWPKLNSKWKSLLKRAATDKHPGIDAFIVYPRVKDPESREHWFDFADLKSIIVRLQQAPTNEPRLVQMWSSSKAVEDGVPIDQSLVNSKNEAELLLPSSFKPGYLRVLQGSKEMVGREVSDLSSPIVLK